jgi:hypothetical protein
MRRGAGILALSLAVTASVSISAAAEAVVSFESLLAQPIQQRVSGFAAHSDKGFVFLSKTAFDAKQSLQTRWRAVTTMGRLDPVRFHSDIDRALNSREWFMRNAGLIALLSDRRARAVTWSTKLLNDPALMVRTQAVRNIIALNARETEPILWKLIYDRRNFNGHSSLWIRAHMAEALAKFAGPGRTKKFERLLLDEDPRLYKWAIAGLEASTGMRMSDSKEPVERRRQQWLARLGIQAI